MNLTNENNILTKLAAVLQILILSCIRFQTDSCPASVENISQKSIRGILLKENISPLRRNDVISSKSKPHCVRASFGSHKSCLFLT